jgi:hypothetical protein
MTRLYHFTCLDHGLPGIERDQALMPQRQHILPGHRLIWLTDLELPPDPHLLGLGKALPDSCDRMAVRFTVETRFALPWRDYAAVQRIDPRKVFEVEVYRSPEHMWVCPAPIRRYTMEHLKAVSA